MTSASGVPTDGEGSSERDKYAEALRRFADAGDTRLARSVYDSMRQRDVPVGEHHYRLLLKAYTDRRDVAGAREILQAMTAAGYEADPDVRYDMAVATARAGRGAEALRILDELHEARVEPPVRHGPAVLHLYLSAGRFAAARSVVRRMVDAGMTIRSADWQRLLADVLERRAINDARSLVELMQRAGTPPSRDQVSRLVTMMARANHPDRAGAMVELARSAGSDVDPAVRAEILLAHARRGEVEAASEQVARMQAEGVATTSYHDNAMLEARIAGEDLTGAWREAEALFDRARIPTGRNLDALLALTLGAGRRRQARGVLDWMFLLGSPAPVDRAAEVVGAFVKAGELDDALALYRELAAHGLPRDRRQGRNLVESLVRAQRLDDARALLDELRRTRTLTHGRHYGSLLSAYVRRRRVDDAVGLLRELVAAKIEPAATDVATVVGALTRGGQLDQARALLDELAERGVSVDEATYRDLMWAFARAQRHDPAKAVFDRMIAAGIEPDERHTKALEWASGETARRLDDVADETPTPPSPGADAPAGAAVTGSDPPPPEGAAMPVPDPASPSSEDAASSGRDVGSSSPDVAPEVAHADASDSGGGAAPRDATGESSPDEPRDAARPDERPEQDEPARERRQGDAPADGDG